MINGFFMPPSISEAVFTLPEEEQKQALLAVWKYAAFGERSDCQSQSVQIILCLSIPLIDAMLKRQEKRREAKEKREKSRATQNERRPNNANNCAQAPQKANADKTPDPTGEPQKDNSREPQSAYPASGSQRPYHGEKPACARPNNSNFARRDAPRPLNERHYSDKQLDDILGNKNTFEDF